MPEQRLLTYEDLLDFPDDGLRREILDGELVVSPSPKLRHQEILGRLHFAFALHLRQQGGAKVFFAPLDVLLSKHNVLEPDLMVVLDAQREILTIPNVKGAPALVVEVVSQSRMDRVRKRDIYERHGVAEYWVVDPDADRVEVLRLRDGRYDKPQIFEPGETLTYDALPGFTLDLSELFERDDA